MSELVQEFTSPTQDGAGRLYTARVRGDSDSSGQWQGWIEFQARDGGPALQTGRETTHRQLDHLRSWAAGLTAEYLVAALHRARWTHSTSPPAPPPLENYSYDAARIGDAGPDTTVVEVELQADPSVALRFMHKPQLRAGQVRRVPGGGIVVYEGTEGPRHRFLFQYGSDNAAAVLGNRLWGDLRDEGVTVRIRGRRVPLTSHDLAEALRSHL